MVISWDCMVISLAFVGKPVGKPTGKIEDLVEIERNVQGGSPVFQPAKG